MKKVICHDKDGNEKEFNSQDLHHRPSVYGILIEDEKILLAKSWGGYDFPGGGVELHETVEQALVREFWEETGINIEVGKLIHCQTSFFIMGEKAMNSTLIYYLCTKISGELSKDNLVGEEKNYMDMPEWISMDGIDKIKFYNSIDSPALIKRILK